MPAGVSQAETTLEEVHAGMGEGITTVPAANIRRIAAEFGREARIGSTIMVEGANLPYRPVAAIAFRGAQGHMNSVYNFYAIDLLNELVGASDVVGGCLGFNPACNGFPETGRLRYVPKPDADGLMITGMWMGYHYPYPIGEPRMPQLLGLQDLFTLGMTSPFLDSDDQEELWTRFELPYRPEAMINFGANLLMSIANRETVNQQRQVAHRSDRPVRNRNDTLCRYRAAGLRLPADAGFAFQFSVHLQPAGGDGRMVLADPPAGAPAGGRAAPLSGRAARTRRPHRLPRRSQRVIQCHDEPCAGMSAAGGPAL
jgi:hypothetical protein